MKYVTPELKALLDSGAFVTANLYTLTLQDGTVILTTSQPDYAVVWSGNTFSHDGLSLEHGSIRQSVGIEVDNVDMTLLLNDTDNLQGLPVPHFVRNGGFNSARCLIQRGYFAKDAGGNVNPHAVGVIFRFEGRVTEPQSGRTQVLFKLVADTELLNVMMPRNTITQSCMNLLYDGRCGKQKADYSHNGTIISATKTTISCSLSQADDYFSLGTIRFTSGQNIGVLQSVKKYTAGQFLLSRALEVTPAVGDTFVAVAGCDLSETTCQSRFNNLPNRRAFKYVPVYEENL